NTLSLHAALPICGGEKEIRVAESLHDEERLRVAGHGLLGEPRTERLLVVESLPLDASIPCVHSFARALLQEPRRHVPHRLPITRFGHPKSPSCDQPPDCRDRRKNFPGSP